MPRWPGTSTTCSSASRGSGAMAAGWARAGPRRCGSTASAWLAAERLLVGPSLRHPLVHALQHLRRRGPEAAARVAAAAALDLPPRHWLPGEPPPEIGPDPR